MLRDGTILALAVANMRMGQRAGNDDRGNGGWIARSTDGGKTWSVPELIRAWPLRGAYPWDNPIEMEDGTLLLAVYGTADNAHSGGSYHERSRNALLWSDDKGQTWYCYGTIAFDPAGCHDFWEPSIALTPDGRLVALSRQGMANLWNNPPAGHLFFSESEDHGLSWTPFRGTNVWGYPPDLVTLQDGSILNIYGHRKDPMSIKVVVSEDGRTWLEQNANTLYDAPNYDTRDLKTVKHGIDTGYRHIGYPSATVLDDGTVLAVFHSFSADKKQIVLVARFKMVKA
jgi:sialidase-1